MKLPRSAPRISIKRAYEAPEPGDGLRVLVDRLWPRGLRKDRAHIDIWLKEIAPSAELRRWFNHDPARWDEFQRRYSHELSDKVDIVNELRRLIARGKVTLLFAARDVDCSNAVALQSVLKNLKLGPGRGSSRSSR